MRIEEHDLLDDMTHHAMSRYKILAAAATAVPRQNVSVIFIFIKGAVGCH